MNTTQAAALVLAAFDRATHVNAEYNAAIGLDGEFKVRRLATERKNAHMVLALRINELRAAVDAELSKN